jgi:hypothetical protein
MTILNPPKFVTRSLIGAMGLSAIAFLGVPDVAFASGAECGLNEGVIQGLDWVSNCPEGSDHFHNTWATVIFNVLPGNPLGLIPGTYQEIFGGPAWIIREQGANGIINTTIQEGLTNIPALGDLGLSVSLIGNGTGAIVDDGSVDDYDGLANSGYAGSYFDVLAQIDSNNLSLIALNPLRVYGDRGLTGVSPDAIIPPAPGEPNYIPPNPNYPGLNCNPIGEVAINYCGLLLGAPPVELFIDGNPNQSAGIFIVAETHTVHPPVPEPSTTLGLLFLGLGSVAGLKRKNKTQE